MPPRSLVVDSLVGSLFASMACVACARGEVDDLPVFDAAVVPDDGAVKRDGSTPEGGPARQDAAPPGADAAGDDDAGPRDDATPGDDAAPSDDAGPSDSGPIVDSGPTIDASDSGPTGPATKPAQGEVLITEVMFDPTTAEPDTEWFELYNAANGPRDVGGLVLGDGTRTETIAGSVVIASGAYVVFANAKIGATVPAASVAYHYSTLQLANSSASSSVTLVNGGTTVAQAPYGGFSATLKTSGDSLQLTKLTYADESTSASWCKSTLAWSGSTDKGTPGAAAKCQ